VRKPKIWEGIGRRGFGGDWKGGGRGVGGGDMNLERCIIIKEGVGTCRNRKGTNIFIGVI
jgi:hypothetical protein